MSATYTGPAMEEYRDAVAERLRAGEAFGEVERDIDGIAELSEDQRDALWLFAFVKRESAFRRPARPTHLSLTT